MTFRSYLEDEDDKPYYHLRTLAYYYENMEGFAEKVDNAAKTLNLTKEDIEKRISAKLDEWDQNIQAFPESVTDLLQQWTVDGTIDTVIQTALIDEKIQPLTAQLADIAINVKSFGAKGDGVTDDTLSIQNALNSGRKVIIPKGRYMINAVTSLKMNSNQTLVFEDGSIFKAIPNNSPAYTVIMIDGKTNVNIVNATIIGERYEHTGTTGEWGAGIRVYSSKNITIEKTVVSDSWGDGIYIGASDKNSHTLCENVLLRNVVCDKNRRLGLALTGVKDVYVYDSVFKNTGGFSPESGVDIEPNDGFICDNVKFFNCDMSNNNSSGFIASIVSKGIVKNVSLFECMMKDNKGDGAELIGSLNVNLTNCHFEGNRNGVNVYVESKETKIVNSVIKDNLVMGVRSYNATETIVENNTIEFNADNGIFFKGVRNKAIRNNVKNNLKTGILVDVGSDFSEIHDNDVLDNTQTGIYVSANNVRVTKNYVSGNALNNTSSSIEIYSQKSLVKYNEVRRGSGSAVYGLRMTAGTNNVVTHNELTGSGVTGDLLAITQTNSTIHSNFDALKLGTSIQRPVNVESGFEYYDVTLGKSIFWNGSAWRDSNGTSPENRGINVQVGTGLSSLTVAFSNLESNAFYSVSVIPQWNTTAWVSDKTTSGFTVNFSTPPTSASAVDWSVRR